VVWFSWTDILAAPEAGIAIRDIWEMRNGDFLTITNRIEDIPEWFSFHPTEVHGALAYRMIEKFEKSGYPEEPMEGPNIWRPKSGDRLVWAGKPHPGVRAGHPIISAIAFRENALVIGENVRTQSMDGVIGFGSLSKTHHTEEEAAILRKTVEVVKQMGPPRNFATEWGIG